MGSIRYSYLIFLSLIAVTLLFFAAYISSSSFNIQLPKPRSKPLVMKTTFLQNHITVITKTPKHVFNSLPNPTVIATAVSEDAISVDALEEIIYDSGYIDLFSKICPDLGLQLELMIMITSAPDRSEERKTIRQTWGQLQMYRNISIAFMLGLTLNETLESALNVEEYTYNDIIRGKFIDTPKNITLKIVFMLEWVDNFCPNSAFVLKINDNESVNISKLLSFIGKHKNSDAIIYGQLAKKWKPIQNKNYYFSIKSTYLIPSCVLHNLYLQLNQKYMKQVSERTTLKQNELLGYI